MGGLPLISSDIVCLAFFGIPAEMIIYVMEISIKVVLKSALIPLVTRKTLSLIIYYMMLWHACPSISHLFGWI